MSSGAYAADKALVHQDRLKQLRDGKVPYPVHLHLILADLCNLDCPGCFPPGTLVLTEDGYEKIELVEVGTRVFGHDGELHDIVKTMPHRHRGQLVRIRPSRLGSAITATENHPILSRRNGEQAWRRADEILVGDMVALRLPNTAAVSQIDLCDLVDGLRAEGDRVRARGGKTTCYRTIPLNAAFGELLGAYLGDGYVGQHPDRPASYFVSIACGPNEGYWARRLVSDFSEVFGVDARIESGGGTAGSTRNTIDVNVGQSVVAQVLLKIARVGSHDKQFHPALLGAPREFLEGLLRGYALADGCVDDRSFSTVSRPLALAVYALALKLGMSPTLFEQPGRPSQIKGRRIRAIGSRYLIRVRGDDRSTYDRIVGSSGTTGKPRSWTPVEQANGYFWLPVTSTESKDYDGPVYNFEVEGSNSYIADGVVVHNCAYRMSGYSSNQLFPGPNGERNPQRYLSTELVKQVLLDCKVMGTRAVEFTGGGEPLVHPDALHLIHYAQQLGLHTALITNGLLLGRGSAMELAAKGQWARISIDAATPETFGKVRPAVGGPHPENLHKVLEHLRRLRQTRDRLGTDCAIGAGFVVQKENWHEIYEAARLYRDYGADNIRISGLFTPEGDRYFEGWRAAAEELERKAVRELSSDSFKVHGRFCEKVEDLQKPPDYPKCWYQHLTTYLGANGNLYRCCVTSYNHHGHLANVAERGGLRAAWKSEECQRRLMEFDARSCERCQFNDRNRAIAAALDAPELPPAPVSCVHPFFV